jgi:glutaconate CoA-transferase subunit A
MTGMAEILSLHDAVARFVGDGDTLAMEGFTHLIPHAAGHEIIRQGRRGLHLVRMTPDMVYDQLIGAGCATRLTFSWGGNPGVGSLQRFRDAVENRWPHALEIEEHSHAGMATRYAAGAAGLPFGVLRGYVGTDLPHHTATIRPIECPFTGERLTAVPALNPDVAIVHAQRADREGNVRIVTVEEIVDSLQPTPNSVVLPTWVVSAVCEVPRGAHPSFAMGYSSRDNAFYRDWDAISKDRDSFTKWIDDNVLGTRDHAEHLTKIGITT